MTRLYSGEQGEATDAIPLTGTDGHYRVGCNEAGNPSTRTVEGQRPGTGNP